jgi:hypothetical protein
MLYDILADHRVILMGQGSRIGEGRAIGFIPGAVPETLLPQVIQQ